jgi:hypothetical protein
MMENFQQLEILETGSLMCLECLGLVRFDFYLKAITESP